METTHRKDEELFIESFLFAINTTAIRLAIHSQFLGNFNTFIPATAEILIIEMNSQLLAQRLTNLTDQIMLLIAAVKQCGGKGIIIFFFGLLRL